MYNLNLMKEYEIARLYILDVCDYDIEIVVACYKIYEEMMKLYPKANGKLIEKDFVVGRFLKYVDKNYKKQEIKMLYDYYFENKSYNEIAEKYNTIPYDVMKSLKEQLCNFTKVNTTDNWFVMSQRKAWVEAHLKEVVELEFNYRKTKAVTNWETVEDMGLTRKQQLILQKHNIITVEQLLKLEEESLFKLFGKTEYNSFKPKLELAKTVL